MDDNQASASARSARASLLHRWDDRSDAVAIKLHAKSSDLGGASLPDVAPADRASIRGSGARSAGRRRVPSGCGADGSCAARRTFVPPPSAGGRVRAGAAAGDHRFHASAPQLARVPVAVTAAIGDHRVRTATSEPSARGNRRAAPPRMSSGSPWPPTKRQPTPAICRNAGKRAQSPGNADAVHVARIKGIRCKRLSFRRDGRTTENRGVPGSSPGLAIHERPGKLRFSVSVQCPALSGEEGDRIAAGVGGDGVDEVGVQAAALQPAGGVC